MNTKICIIMTNESRKDTLMNINCLLELIERKRTELIKTAQEEGMSSNAVLILSQELDDLLNSYTMNSKNYN